jgi:hypothetical protein
MVDNINTVDMNIFGIEKARIMDFHINSKITFILNFPENKDTEKQVITSEFPGTRLFKDFLNDIKALLPHRANERIKFSFIDNYSYLIEIEEEESGKGLCIFSHFVPHKDFKDGETKQTFEINVFFKSSKFYLKIVASQVNDREKIVIDKFVLKVKSGLIKNFQSFEYAIENKYDNPFQIGKNDYLVIAVDEAFMENVCQQEAEKAKAILIKADPKNNVALAIQEKWGEKKITAINKNLELLLNLRYLP